MNEKTDSVSHTQGRRQSMETVTKGIQMLDFLGIYFNKLF